MIMLILSIIYWCKPDLEGLGIAAIIFNVIGIISDAALYGWLCLIDVAFLVVNILVYNKHHNKEDE